MNELRRMERRIIGALVWNGNQNFLELTKNIKPECFTDERCGWLFTILRERTLAGQPLDDLLMLEQEMKRHGHQEVTAVDIIEMTEESSAIFDIREYIAMLLDGHQRRSLQRELTSVLRQCEDASLSVTDILGRAMNGLSNLGGLTEDRTLCLHDALTLLHKRVDENISGVKQAGFRTGFEQLDQYGGFHTQDLVIVGGWSSHGKTALALSMAMNAVRLSEARVLILSMEMAALQIGARILAPEAGIPGSVMMFRALKERGLQEFDRAVGRMEELADRVFIADSSVQGMEAILGSIRMHHARFGTRLVVVDYLQIIGQEGYRNSSREEVLADMARRLKNIAKELDICVILLSQVNREAISSPGSEPTAGQLRGSGQINEAADLTLMVYRPEVFKRQYPAPFENTPTHGTALIKVEKDRNGGYGGISSFIVGFDGATTHFQPMPSEE